VPKIQVILRKSYGGAPGHVLTDLGADRVFAWPTAEVRRHGGRGGGGDRLPQGDGRAPDKAARRAELIEKYRSTFATPYVAAGRRLVDDVIDPADRATWPRPWSTSRPSAISGRRRNTV
jgi:methylmalonyl-CoA carboxyltransferase large subunit